MIRGILLLTIFLIPLLGNLNGFGYEQVKIVYFILSISLISLLWLFHKPDIKLTEIGKTAAVFILILFLTSLGGLDFKTSFLGSPPYFHGLLIYSYLFLFYLIIKSLNIEFKYYALSLTISGLIVSLRAIEEWISQNIFNMQVPNYAGRVVSSFGQPNFFAGFLLLILPFSYYLSKNKKLSLLGRIGGAVSMVGILISYSRAAIFLSLGLIFFYLILRLSGNKKWIVVLSLIVIFSGSLLTSFYLKSGIIYKEFLEPSFIAGNTTDPILNSVEKRAYIWPVLINLSLQKPTLGYGIDNIASSFTNYFIERRHLLFEETNSVSDVLIRLKDLRIDRTHNYTLDLMLFSGIFGVLSWILLVFLLLKKILSSNTTLENNTLLLGFLTYLIWIQFQNQSIVHLLYFWFLTGAIDKSID